MVTWRTILYVSTFLCLSCFAQGQCVQDQAPSINCMDAIPICGAQLNGYSGVLPDFPAPSGPNPLCFGQGVVNNTVWIAFIPTSDFVEIEVTASCDTVMQAGLSFTGLQGGIYGDCMGFEAIDCRAECDLEFLRLSGPVEPNRTYYLLLDGCAGSVCEFTLRTTFGTFVGNYYIVGYDTVCVDNPVSTYSIESLDAMARVEWLVDDLITQNVVDEDLIVTDWGGLDSTLICAIITQDSLIPDTICKMVYINDFNSLQAGPFTYCPEDDGYLYSDGQTYPEGDYEIIDSTGACAAITRFEVNVREVDSIELFEEKICSGDTVFFDNQIFTQPVDTIIVLEEPTPFGCEDRVRLVITPQVDSIEVYSRMLCPGDTAYFFYGLFFTEAIDTTIIRPVPSQANCNDQQRIIITLFPADSLEVISGNLCPGETFSFDGQTYSAPLDTILTLSTPSPDGCEDQVQLIITSPSLQLQSDSFSCPGTFTAYIEAVVMDGMPPFQYEWEGPIDLPADSIINNLPAGWYQLTFTDGAGCVFQDSLEIGEYPEIEAEVVTTPANVGQSDGTAEIIFNGGTPPFSTVWAVPGMPMDVLRVEDLAAGEYEVIVIDGNGCQRLYAFEIMMSTSLGRVAEGLDWEIYPNPTAGGFWLRGAIGEERKVAIWGVQGRLEYTAMQWPAGQESLWVDGQTLPNGVYWIVVETEQGNHVQKLVKLE